MSQSARATVPVAMDGPLIGRRPAAERPIVSVPIELGTLKHLLKAWSIEPMAIAVG